MIGTVLTDPSRTVALVFPGQGSQRPGMAKDFHDSSAVASATFEEASDAVGVDLREICFGEDPRLDQTEYTQPAILTAEIAMARALAADHGLEGSSLAGHSLGEYTALCVAGAVPLHVAVKLVRRRGALMQAAVPAGAGAMVAVVAEGIAADPFVRSLADLGVDIANKNAPDQVVLSGASEAVARATALLSEHLAGREHRLVPLNVSAPFHSRAMRAIEPAFRAELLASAGSWIPERASRVVSNLTGRFHQPSLPALFDALTGQLAGTVDWISNMAEVGGAAQRILEIGPSRVLRGFFAKVGRDISSITTVRAAVKELG